MKNKISSAITGILLNRATFSNVPINNLSFVNYFYGNNGVGKSTIARLIESKKNLLWHPDKDESNYDVLVFNADFINNNFVGYDNLPGVFILGEENAEAIRRIEELTTEKELKIKARDADRARYKSVLEEESMAYEDFQDYCFTVTASLRKCFDQALDGKKQKKSLAEAILSEKSPKEHNIAELEQVYSVAFDENSTSYSELIPVSKSPDIQRRCEEILDKVIISSSDTVFSKFLKALNASDWVRSGHSHFSDKANGKCPYCQQKLPSDFEANIISCFDDQYQQNINILSRAKIDYQQETSLILTALKNNLNQSIPTYDMSLYKEKLSNLEHVYEINNQRLFEKGKEPSREFVFEKDEQLLIELNAIIADVNTIIKRNNQVVIEKRANKLRCKTEIMQHIAFLVADKVKEYKTGVSNLANQKRTIENRGKQLNAEINICALEIEKLNKHNVNTKFAIDNINKVIETSGFQGFKLREKQGDNNVYEVVREDGTVASNLSEGERNFIAFLYFYHLVRGSRNDSEFKDKIVVIDDPVSSMDSTALFLVSSIVREMVRVCLNNVEYYNDGENGDYIKQIFILTHNVYFYKEIVYGQVPKYESTSFYLIRKQGNVSDVKLCVRNSPDAPSALENFSPVQNSYSALWTELNEVTSSITIQNVMRRILEYYFMQLCGYDGNNVRDIVLGEKNRDKFIKKIEGQKPDMTEYHLAESLLAFITSSHGIMDGLNYVDDCEDVDAYRRVFKRIFEVLCQDQHYRMMIGK